MADMQPYGDVAYADPGYLDAAGNQASKSGKPGVKRYPIDAEHVKAAWTYINQSDNASQYTAEQLGHIKDRIRAAMKKFGHTVSEQQNSLTSFAERRYTTVPVEVRAGGKMRIGGYAAKFDTRSDNLGGFVERVDYAFFERSKGNRWPGVIARYNHDDNHLLGTTDAGTLRLDTDRTGLLYDVDLPNARADVHELVQRGDVRQSSFAFVVAKDGDDWTTEDGIPLRTLLSGRLIDVAPVNTPAYQDTSVGLRSLARRFDADFEEVRKMAAAHDLMRFFRRTDDAPRGPVRGSMALARVRNVSSV